MMATAFAPSPEAASDPKSAPYPLWRGILQVARWTPSSHNTQPWKIKLLSPTEASLFIDRNRMLPKVDTESYFIVSNMMMFVEAIRIVAANAGYRLNAVIEENIDTARPLIPFASLHLTPENGIAPLYSNQLFLQRHTSRARYQPIPVPPDVVAILQDTAKTYHTGFTVLTGKQEIEQLLSWNIEAIFDDFNDPNYHGEILEWMRFSRRTSQETKDGLNVEAMAMSPAEFWSGSKLTFLYRIPGVRATMKWLYRRKLGPILTIAYLSAPFHSLPDAKQTGLCLIHLWLQMAKHGLYMHPFGNLVTNAKYARLTQDLLHDKQIWLFFKLGYSRPAPQRYRLDMQDIVLHD